MLRPDERVAERRSMSVRQAPRAAVDGSIEEFE
jgi:hypothetical protein